MNIKKLALIGSLAGLSGCCGYIVPAGNSYVAPRVITPAPVVITPAVVTPTVVVPAYPVYHPLWIGPHFHRGPRW